jgi:hypothetical protein
VLRGRVGARTSRTAIAFVFSDFGRRDGVYTTLSTVQPLVLDQDSQEELELERRILRLPPHRTWCGASVWTLSFDPGPRETLIQSVRLRRLL